MEAIIIIGAAIAGAAVVVLVAGPAGLLAGPWLATVAYAAMGAVLGGVIAFGAMRLMPGPPGSIGGTDSEVTENEYGGEVTLDVTREDDSLRMELREAGKVLADTEFRRAVTSPGASLAFSINRMFDEAQLASGMIHVKFAGVGPVQQDLVIQELRNQGIRVSHIAKPEE